MNAVIITAGQEIPGRLYHIMKGCFITCALAIASLILLAFSEYSYVVTWNRNDPVGLEIWFSHFAHWSTNHLFWDLLVFFVLGVLIEGTSRWLMPAIILVASPVIIVATWIFGHHLSYRGLSGLDCALYAAVLVIGLNKSWLSKPGFLLFICGLLGKSVIEITTGETLFVSDLPTGVTAVPWAHISGALAGLTVAWGWFKFHSAKG